MDVFLLTKGSDPPDRGLCARVVFCVIAFFSGIFFVQPIDPSRFSPNHIARHHQNIAISLDDRHRDTPSAIHRKDYWLDAVTCIGPRRTNHCRFLGNQSAPRSPPRPRCGLPSSRSRSATATARRPFQIYLARLATRKLLRVRFDSPIATQDTSRGRLVLGHERSSRRERACRRCTAIDKRKW